MAKTISKETMKKRVKTWREAREELYSKVDQLHVRLQGGNRKTGRNCMTVSLLPIIDCSNCLRCGKECYDVKSDMIMPNVVNDRLRNSVIHKLDPERYWRKIDCGVKSNYVTMLRINVGGDLTDEDFFYVAKLGRDNPKTDILFFTKNYKGINKFLATDSFPDNVHAIMSVWEKMEIENPYQLPCSHVLFDDGRTTAPEYGAVFCGGNCSECHFNGEGCWNLKKGEHVIFKYH